MISPSWLQKTLKIATKVRVRQRKLFKKHCLIEIEQTIDTKQWKAHVVLIKLVKNKFLRCFNKNFLNFQSKASNLLLTILQGITWKADFFYLKTQVFERWLYFLINHKPNQNYFHQHLKKKKTQKSAPKFKNNLRVVFWHLNSLAMNPQKLKKSKVFQNQEGFNRTVD